MTSEIPQHSMYGLMFKSPRRILTTPIDERSIHLGRIVSSISFDSWYVNDIGKTVEVYKPAIQYPHSLERCMVFKVCGEVGKYIWVGDIWLEDGDLEVIKIPVRENYATREIW